MSVVKLNYDHLENAQYVYEMVQNNYSSFDWGCENASWEKNSEALWSVCETLDMPFEIYHVETQDDEFYCVAYHDDTIKREIIVMTQYDWLALDFSWPLDVVDIINEIMGEVKRMKINIRGV